MNEVIFFSSYLFQLSIPPDYSFIKNLNWTLQKGQFRISRKEWRKKIRKNIPIIQIHSFKIFTDNRGTTVNTVSLYILNEKYKNQR